MYRVLLCLVAAGAASGALAQERTPPTRFWNLTLYTVNSLQLSPPGKNAWGENQCKNDRDGTVDHNERLRITGIDAGRYDVRLSDKTGRNCIVRNVEVKDGAIFTIEEKDLTDCQK